MVSLVAFFLPSKGFGSNSCTYVLYNRIDAWNWYYKPKHASNHSELVIIFLTCHQICFHVQNISWGPRASWDFIDFLFQIYTFGIANCWCLKRLKSREKDWEMTDTLSRESNRIPPRSNWRSRPQSNSLLQCNCLFLKIGEKESTSLNYPENEKSDKYGKFSRTFAVICRRCLFLLCKVRICDKTLTIWILLSLCGWRWGLVLGVMLLGSSTDVIEMQLFMCILCSI